MKPPPLDTPPLDTPPLDTPPLDTPPLDTPPLDTGPLGTGPLDGAARLAKLGGARGQFLLSLIGEAAVFHVLKSGTRIDVGFWLFKRRVWTCMLDREMLLFAMGKRPYVERIPLEELHQSRYNHVTGQLVLAPAESARLAGLKMRPLEGLQIISHIHRGEKRK